MKKALLILAILLTPFLNAADVTVNNVFLGEKMQIDANFEDSSIAQNTLCKFLFYETGNDFIVDRATDEYILDNNHVYSVNFKMNEPPFFRDQNYTIKIICAGTTKETTFVMENRRSIGTGIQKELEFALKPQHLDLLFILGFFIIMFLILGYVIWFCLKRG